MKSMTKADAARHLNVSRTTIYNMINRGVLTPNAHGLIDVEQLDDQSCKPCTGERQGKNIPVEFRDASPLIMARYVNYLEHPRAGGKRQARYSARKTDRVFAGRTDESERGGGYSRTEFYLLIGCPKNPQRTYHKKT
jgi:hypothetical protein